MLAQALTAATAIPDDSARAWALTGLAPHLPADQQPAVLAQALTAATAIPGDAARAWALTGLAPHLPADQQPAVLAQALTAATAIPDDARPRPGADRAGAAPAPRPAGPGAHRRHRHPRRLLPRPGADRAGTAPARQPAPAVLAQALTAATAIRLRHVRAQALTELAPHLPPDLLEPGARRRCRHPRRH